MNLIDQTPDSTPEAEKRARALERMGNQAFAHLVSTVERFVHATWYANGDGELTGDEPTGEQILQAMGTNAEDNYQDVIDLATALVTIATRRGKASLIPTTISGPMDVTFNPDGSVNTVTPKA